jgi:geranylgeranyl pyrophosphate synthase
LTISSAEPSVRLGAFLERAREATDAAIAAALDEVLEGLAAPLPAVVRYAALGPGKRFRPALVLAAYEAAGGRSPRIADLAAAVEIVHAYSLVHDDLPCMDNDDLRRGRPTAHRAYGVRAATVAGFGMVPVAAAAVVRGGALLALTPEATGRVLTLLFRAAGAGGMIGGQVMDLAAGGRRPGPDELLEVNARKTGALITASAEIGAVAAGLAPAACAPYRAYGRDVGAAFQIADDVLDLTATSDQLGKTPGKDVKLGKPTFPLVFGVEPARREADRLAARAVAHLEDAGISSPLLAALARFVVSRSL